MKLPFVSVNYDEPDVSTYRGVSVKFEDYQELFNSGNPEEDMRDALTVIVELGYETFLHSSSVDHFEMDGGTWGGVI